MANVNPRIRAIADHYGTAAQLDKLVEECIELAHAVQRLKANKGPAVDVLEEIADVRIVAEQVTYLLSDDDDCFVIVERIAREKIARTERRIEEADNA